MMQRVWEHLKARYPEAPKPEYKWEPAEDYKWERLFWPRTAQGNELQVTSRGPDCVEVDYPGIFGGFDEFHPDDPRLVSELASQLFPEEPLDHGIMNCATVRVATTYPDPGRFYPHRFVGSSLVDPWIVAVFRTLYPKVVALVGDVAPLWRPPDHVAHDWLLSERLFTDGEPQMARWFDVLRHTQPQEYQRWSRMWRELPQSPLPSYDVYDTVSAATPGVVHLHWVPPSIVGDHGLLRAIFRPRAWLNRNHPDPTVRRLVAFLRAVEQGEPIPEVLTPAQIRAVTRRTRYVFTLHPSSI